MANKAKAAKEAVADEPKGFKSITQEDREWLLGFEAVGWTVDFDEDGGDEGNGAWSANKADEALEGFETYVELMNEVERVESSVFADGVAPVKSDIKGNTYLPGAEPLSVPYLDNLTQRRIALVREFKTAAAAVGEINTDILNAYNDDKYQPHFVLDNNTGKHQYNAAGGGGLRINHRTVDKVESFDEPIED